jgi:hypothetical protein
MIEVGEFELQQLAKYHLECVWHAAKRGSETPFLAATNWDREYILEHLDKVTQYLIMADDIREEYKQSD